MESFKILSISKTTGSVPLSSKDSTEVWYVFTLMYGHESFQLQKTTEDLKAMIASTNEVFPLLALESQSVYHESSKSFLLEDLKAYFNKVFQMMYDESLKSTTTTTAGSNTTLSVNIGSISSTNSSSSRGILAYPKILAHIDPTLINSTLIRTSLLLQQNKIRVLTDQVEKLQNRLSTTEGLIAQCKQIADSLATTRANTTTSATTPKTTDSEVVRVDTVDELETPGGVGTGSFSERDSDNELTPGFNSKSIPADSGELIKYEEEVEEIDSSEDDEEGDRAIVSSLNPESVEQVVQYFRANLPSLLYFAGIVDILLEKTKPKTQEMNHRIAIIDYLKSQIRLSLSCSLFVTDLEEIGSPTFGEKKIVLTLLIGKSYQASWDSILLEHLQYLSETGGYQNQRQVKIIRKSSSSALDPNNSSSFVISDDYGDFEVPAGNNNLSDHDIPTSFRIKQIALHNNDPTSSYPYLTCRINNRPVEIRTDPTIDLCFLGLLEEISTLIGRDDLFKKSFSLISSFLFNEQTELFMKNSSNGVPTTASTSNESEKGLKSHKQPIIPNTILWIMVTSIFNKYFSYIESPIQALILFFIEFMTYDPLHTVITLYGVLEYRQVNNPASSNGGLSAGSSSSSLQTIFLGKANYLIKPKLLEKYWNAVNVEEVNVNSEIFNSTLITNPLVNRKFQSNLIAFYTYHPNANAFYAIHPFSYQVLQSEPIPLNTTNSQIYEIFQFGLMKFNHLMETMSTIPREQITETLVYETFMEHIFPKVQKKLFKLDSKPTTPAKIALEDACYVKPDKYMDAIYYCNFILKSLITEPAILYACIEMIDMKGTLPVGEIGKVVTLHSNIAQLSLHLKEKFGGLKKFLEKFPGIFVFGNDHQYNPHVFLRERLSIEHQRMIYRGVLPMQIILQYKKAKNNRKATKRVVVGISGASLNEKSFNSSNPENDTISVGSSNFGLTASLTGAAPAANISPQAMPAPYFAQSAALTSNNAISPQQEFSSYSGSVRLGAVGSLEVVPPGIFKPSQNLDFPPTAALASQLQGGYTYNNSNAAPAAYPSRAPDLSTYGDRGSFTHSNLQSEGRYSTYSSQPTSYSFNYDSTRNVRQGNASYNFPSGANYTENLTHSGVSQANYSSFNGLNLGGPSPHAEEMSQYPHSTYSSAMPSNTASQNKFNPYR